MGKKVYNTGKEFLNMGMYTAEGRNFRTEKNYDRYNINNTRKEDYKKKEDNIVTNMQEQDKL